MGENALGDSILARIREHEAALSPSESRVARFCRDNPNEVVNKSIHEVAKMAGVSVSSVSRLASALGYRDWKDMRLSVARDMVRYDHMARRENPIFSEIAAGDTDMAVVRKVFNAHVASLWETLEGLDQKVFMKAMKAIVKTPRLVFFGSGGSGYVAHDEALRFSHLDLAAEAYSDGYQMMLQASRMKKGQVAVGICNSGRTHATVSALEVARANGARTIGVSGFRGTPLEGVSDMFLATAPVHSEFITASLTPRLSVLFIMDALYCLAAQHGRMSESLDTINGVLESKLRIPRK